MGWQQQLARQQLVRMVAAAIVLIAAFAVPSLASAHEGHGHHASSAVRAAPTSTDMQAHKQVTVTVTSATVLSATRDSAIGAAGVLTTCGGNCCGGATGMACCGAALAPELFYIPLVQASAPLVIPRAPPLPGLPPEALPKPPKSIA